MLKQVEPGANPPINFFLMFLQPAETHLNMGRYILSGASDTMKPTSLKFQSCIAHNKKKSISKLQGKPGAEVHKDAPRRTVGSFLPFTKTHSKDQETALSRVWRATTPSSEGRPLGRAHEETCQHPSGSLNGTGKQRLPHCQLATASYKRIADVFARPPGLTSRLGIRTK